MNKVSIIVPVYNGEKDIERAVQSLLDQTVETDIIVINDGSSDKTEEILLRLQKDHPNIRYFYKENSGVSDCRNMGIEKVETEYFGFLDSDDYVKKDMVEKMLKKIEETKSDVCFCDFIWKFEDREKIQKDTGYKDKHELLKGLFAVLWNKLYRTSWFKSTGLKCPNVISDEDSSLLYRLVLHMDKVCYVEEPFIYYVQRKTSLRHTFNKRVFGVIEVLDDIRQYYIDHGVYDEYKEEIEYLYIRYYLGNTYLAACRITDKEMRKKALDLYWEKLNGAFPDYRKNRYLNEGGKKNAYFRAVNKTMYYSMPPVFRLLYRFGLIN